jgi:hypothetical protein
MASSNAAIYCGHNSRSEGVLKRRERAALDLAGVGAAERGFHGGAQRARVDRPALAQGVAPATSRRE